MSEALTILPFSTDFEFVALREFRNGGFEYKAGDWIPKGPEYATDERQLRILYENRYIGPRKGELVERKEPVAASSAPAPEPTASPKAEDDGHLPLRVKHKGFGRWFVVDGGMNDAAGPYTSREAAEQVRDNLLRDQREEAAERARAERETSNDG